MSKVFDVSRPGTTPANPTSKPVIVGPTVQDPSITLNGVGDRRTAAPAPAGPRKIEISDGAMSAAPALPVEPTAPAPEAPAAPTEPAPEPEAPAEEAQAIADTALSETVSAPDVPTTQQVSDEDLANIDHNQPLQLPPHYHTSPIRTVFLVLLTLLLAAAILDVLLDADMVVIQGFPHTNFL